MRFARNPEVWRVGHYHVGIFLPNDGSREETFAYLHYQTAEKLAHDLLYAVFCVEREEEEKEGIAS